MLLNVLITLQYYTLHLTLSHLHSIHLSPDLWRLSLFVGGEAHPHRWLGEPGRVPGRGERAAGLGEGRGRHDERGGQ